MKLIMDISTYTEYADDVPDTAVTDLTKEQIQELLKLSEVVKKHDLYRVTIFDSRLDYMVDTDEDTLEPWEGRVEAVTLNVTSTDFYWSGYYKHTNIRWETTSVGLAEILHCSEISKYMDLEYDARSK